MAVCHYVFALIESNEIKNLAVGNYYDCSQAAMATYGEDAVAIDVTQFPVEIGDSYEDGKFYRMIGGVKTEITRVPTVEQQTAANTAAISVNSAAIDELIIAITPTEAN